MADNIILNNGTGGPTIATDEIGGAHYQIVKLAIGDNNSVDQVSTTHPVPVEVVTSPSPQPLVASSAVIGKIGVDQTTPGTTDSVTVKASAGIGSLTETAPVNDTASSGLNGRLQRIAQNITTLIAKLPSALGSTLSANSLSVTPASDAEFVLGASSNIIGVASIDQTTPGQTNGIVINSVPNKSNQTTSTLSASLLVKTSAGVLHGLTGFNNGPTQYLHIHDSTSVPNNGDAPKITVKIDAGSNFRLDFGIYGRVFSNGIVVSNSTTPATLTIGSANLFVDAQYS